jgi:hypothetical protein
MVFRGEFVRLFNENGELWRNATTSKRRPNVVSHIVSVFEVSHRSSLERHDRHTVTIPDSIGRDGRNASAWSNDPSQIQWICSTQENQASVLRRVARFPEGTDSLRQCKLLAGKAAHKPAATDLTACLESP